MFHKIDVTHRTIIHDEKISDLCDFRYINKIDVPINIISRD